MKSVILILSAVLASASVHASIENTRSNDPVPEPQAQTIRDSLVMAIDEMNRVPFHCETRTGPSAPDSYILQAMRSYPVGKDTQVYLDSAGEQPVLRVVGKSQSGGTATLSVTTSEDYRKIVRLKLEDIKTTTQKVNTGTIVNPKIVDVSTVSKIYDSSCEIY